MKYILINYTFLLSINQIDECHISQDKTKKNKFSERSSPERQVYSNNGIRLLCKFYKIM